MTVVPNDDLLTLICDGCADSVSGPACVLPDAEVVWTFVSEHGWGGSPFATGPHHCPRCTLTDDRPGGRLPAPREDRPVALLDVDQVDGVAVVTGTGDIDIRTGDALQAALGTAVAAGGHVLVDLGGVHLIDSTGLGLLVRAHNQARERGRLLCLAAPSRFVRTVLHTMRLDGVFPAFDSREEALGHLRGPGSARLDHDRGVFATQP